MSENLSHDAALDCIVGAAGVTVLSYEEAIDAYFRLRGLGDPTSTPPLRPQGEEGLLARARDSLKMALAPFKPMRSRAEAEAVLADLEAALSNQGKPSS